MDDSPIFNPQFDGNPFFWQGSSTGILLVHGFTATVQEVRPLAQILHQKGYTVAGPLLPGHYTHPDDLNKAHWQDWVSAVREMYQRISSACQTVIVGGESTGGLLSLYLASEHPEIAAVLLYAPALRLTLSPAMVLLLHILAPFKSYSPKPAQDPDSLWQGYRVNPLKGTIQLLRLQKQVYPVLPKIHQPLLIVQGRLDPTVHPTVPDTISSQVNSTVKEIYWMEQSAHCVILDKEREQVGQTTLKFLDKVLQP